MPLQEDAHRLKDDKSLAPLSNARNALIQVRFVRIQFSVTLHKVHGEKVVYHHYLRIAKAAKKILLGDDLELPQMQTSYFRFLLSQRNQFEAARK